MNGIAKKIVIGAVALPLLVEGVQWAAMRQPEHPSLQLRLQHDVPGFKPEIRFTLDSQLRVRTSGWNVQNPSVNGSHVKMLVAGGDSTYGWFQNAEDTWWGQLQSAWEKQSTAGQKLAIAANGTPLITSSWVARWVADVAPKLKPDVIMVTLGAQDVFFQPLEYKYKPNRIDLLPSSLPPDGGLKQLIVKYSQTARRMRAGSVKTEGARISRDFADKEMKKLYEEKRQTLRKIRPSEGPFRVSESDPRVEFQDALNSLQKTAKSINAKLIVVCEPSIVSREMELLDEQASAQLSSLILRSESANDGFRVNPDWFVSEIRRFQEAANEWGTKNQVPVLETHGKVARSPENFLNELILTDKGAKELATVVLPFFTKVMNGEKVDSAAAGLLPASPQPGAAAPTPTAPPQ